MPVMVTVEEPFCKGCDGWGELEMYDRREVTWEEAKAGLEDYLSKDWEPPSTYNTTPRKCPRCNGKGQLTYQVQLGAATAR